MPKIVNEGTPLEVRYADREDLRRMSTEELCVFMKVPYLSQEEIDALPLPGRVPRDYEVTRTVDLRGPSRTETNVYEVSDE